MNTPKQDAKAFLQGLLKAMAEEYALRTTPALFAEWREGGELDRERQFVACVKWCLGTSRELAPLLGLNCGRKG